MTPIAATEGVVSLRDFQDSDRAYVIRTWVLCMQPDGVWASKGTRRMKLSSPAFKTFRDSIEAFPRIALAGGPRTGKTTLSLLVDRKVRVHTDDFRQYNWDQVPERVIAVCHSHPAFIVEGVQVGRCLRKGLQVDLVIWFEEPHEALSKGQMAMRKGCETIFHDWASNVKNGPKVLYF